MRNISKRRVSDSAETSDLRGTHVIVVLLVAIAIIGAASHLANPASLVSDAVHRVTTKHNAS